MKTLVLTSINPYSDITHQKKCFYAWKKAGYETLTFNYKEEARLLFDSGFSSTEVITLTESETAQGLFRKPIPRLLPIINRAVHYNHDAIFITNSDIYPIHQRTISRFLSTISSAIALTRNESVRVQDFSFYDCLPYRGGLDIFFFTKKAFKELFDTLKQDPVSERMTFGIPGWDYYMGAHILKTLSGEIMDGEIFLHCSHKTTYSDPSEFSHYIDKMKDLKVISSQDINIATTEFYNVIDENCKKNRNKSKTLKAAFFSREIIKETIPYLAQKPEILSSYNELMSLLGDNLISRKLKDKKIMGLIEKQFPKPNWEAFNTFTNSRMKGVDFLTCYLIFITGVIITKRNSSSLKTTNLYPKNNSHASAIKQILDNTNGHEQLKYISYLFFSELITYNIYNQNILAYITLSSTTELHVDLCYEIHKLCTENLLK